jgi:hypothetical protein
MGTKETVPFLTIRANQACVNGILLCDFAKGSCFYQLPNSRRRCDWRVLANGRLDRALYESGRLDRTVSFPELRRIGYLNEIANRAPEDGFGDYIRHELERRRHER